MKIKNLINTIFPDKETRKKSVEEDLRTTVDEIIKENKSEKKDEYFMIRLIKQYNRLTEQAQKYEIDTKDYADKIKGIYKLK